MAAVIREHESSLQGLVCADCRRIPRGKHRSLRCRLNRELRLHKRIDDALRGREINAAGLGKGL
jgi:hypothetical protein